VDSAPPHRRLIYYTERVITGPDFSEEHRLADGTPATLRHIRPDDAAELARGFARLSPESRYRRFFGGVNQLTDKILHYLTVVDGRDHVALVATRATDAGEEIGLGVARFVRLAGEPTVAEAAITVVDEVQGRGLGRILSLTLARAARERGIEHFRGEILADNPSARQLLEEVGAVLRVEDEGRLVFDVALRDDAAQPDRFELVVRRMLRAASTYVVGALQRFGFKNLL
jgi:GNAT superfamily N-acetyltransferase